MTQDILLGETFKLFEPECVVFLHAAALLSRWSVAKSIASFAYWGWILPLTLVDHVSQLSL